MSGVATAIGGGAVVGYLGSMGAANTMAGAAGQSIEAQEQMFQAIQNEGAPYRQAGTQALADIQANMPQWNKPVTMADLQMDPGYQFRLAQGQGALTAAAGAGRGVVSGGELAALNNYSQEYASSEYQNAFNRYQQQIQGAYGRLSGVAGLGLQATGISANAGTATAGMVGQGMMAAGQVQASGQIGGANAITSALGTGANMLQTQGILSQLGAQRAPLPQVPLPQAPVPYGGPGGLSGYSGYEETLPAQGGMPGLITT